MARKNILNSSGDPRFERIIDRLVKKGCDRKELLSFAVLIFGKDQSTDPYIRDEDRPPIQERNKRLFYQALGGTKDDPRRRLKSLLVHIEQAARDIEEINQAPLLGSQGLRKISPSGDGDPLIAVFQALPRTLRQYIATVNGQLNLASETFSLKGNPSRKIPVQMLLDYVKEQTGAPNRGLIAEFLSEFATFRGIDDVSGLDADSLEKLDSRR